MSSKCIGTSIVVLIVNSVLLLCPIWNMSHIGSWETTHTSGIFIEALPHEIRNYSKMYRVSEVIEYTDRANDTSVCLLLLLGTIDSVFFYYVYSMSPARRNA